MIKNIWNIYVKIIRFFVYVWILILWTWAYPILYIRYKEEKKSRINRHHIGNHPSFILGQIAVRVHRFFNKIIF